MITLNLIGSKIDQNLINLNSKLCY